MPQIPRSERFWLSNYFDTREWKFARTYAKTSPHSYILRENCDPDDFERAIKLIRKYGVPENFYSKIYIYFYLGNQKYWTMGDPIPETTLINRANANTFYGRRMLLPKANDYDETIYDEFALTYDEAYSTPECLEENEQVFGWLRQNDLGSILDVGCGTGIVLDYLTPDPADYWGADPSQGMVNRLLSKHSKYLVSRSRFEDLRLTRRFQTVLSLFGSPSYLDPVAYQAIRQTAPNYFLMFYKPGYLPDYYSDESPTQTDYYHAEGMFGEPFEFNNFWIFSNLEIQGWREP